MHGLVQELEKLAINDSAEASKLLSIALDAEDSLMVQLMLEGEWSKI